MKKAVNQMASSEASFFLKIFANPRPINQSLPGRYLAREDEH